MKNTINVKGKEIAVLSRENDAFKASTEDIFHSVPTFALAHLLFPTTCL